MAHGLLRGSFVPPAAVQELRDLTRTRKQLVREPAQHTQRIQKTLEDANIKLGSVISDILGVSGRAMLQAIIAGETDPEASAARGRRAAQVLPGRAGRGAAGAGDRASSLFLRLHLRQVDGLQAWIAAIDEEIGTAMEPFRHAVERLMTSPA